MELSKTKRASWLDRFLEPVTQAANGITSVFIVAMMLLTVVDVCGRYFFNKPVLGAFEVTSLMLVIVVFSGMAYTTFTKTHVSVDAIVSHLSPQVQAIFRSVAYLAGLFIFALISWQSFVLSNMNRDRGDVYGILEIPIWPFSLVIALGSALACVVILPVFLQHVAASWRSGWRIKLGISFGIAFFLLICWLAFGGSGLPENKNLLMVGFIGLVLMVVLMFGGMWVGVAMGLVGIWGAAYIVGIAPAFSIIGVGAFKTVSSYSMVVVTLFILMGEFAHHSGLSRELYFTMYKWLGRLPGGLAMATVGACALFGAISGGTVASVATMGTVAIPEMKRYKYDTALAAGCVAAGGTIGILIPPSIILVIYGIIAEQSIGELFAAGFIPGILEAVFYMVTIFIICKRNPLKGPPGERSNLMEKVVSLKNTWAVLILFVLVIGGMYLGVFTPTEAAGIGAFGAFILVVVKRKLKRRTFVASLRETGKTTAMVFFLLIGAIYLNYFLTLSRMPYELSAVITGLQMSRYLVLGSILLMYLFFGCFMGGLPLIIITVPIFLPIITGMGFDPIWYGIIMVRVCEMGAITPPVGLSLFVMRGVAPDIPLETVARGIFPFLLADICHVILLVAFPQLSLFLPNLMY